MASPARLTFCDLLVHRRAYPKLALVIWTHRAILTSLIATAGLLAGACGGSPTAPAEDETFYLHGRGAIDKRYSWERYYPALDREKSRRLPQRVGVAIFEGDVRLSRPTDWYLRTADYTAEQRIISYQSPRQFVFNIYERTDPTAETWEEILKRYEEDVEKSGSKIIAGRIPIATANAQGRSYFVQTTVDTKPAPFDNYAHEVIVRSGRRVLLVQIVHGPDIEQSMDEMTDALRSMLVY